MVGILLLGELFTEGLPQVFTQTITSK
jgi:hypothetical protein